MSAVTANGNITPRSSARVARVESATSSPAQGGDTPSATRPKTIATTRNGNATGLGIANAEQSRARENSPKSLVSDNGAAARVQSPLVRSPRLMNQAPSSPPQDPDTRFFHASDAPKQQEPAPKKPEPKKPAAFFYADGQQEAQLKPLPDSPVLSAISEQRSTGPWIRSESVPNASKSPPILSPGLSSLSNSSPFFAPAAGQATNHRPPSPSKENIHLSYRKGASQIFGTRPVPSPRSTASSTDIPATIAERGGSNDPAASSLSCHHKSPSLSSIDSGNSLPSRQRSATLVDTEPSPSPLAQEIKAATIPRVGKPPNDLPTIDTSLESPGLFSPPESSLGPLSPTKSVSELAADARRERKVLDLEISNSSLLAINTSLEREVRRQKAELKRFRRLSRSGRFSFAPGDWPTRPSDGLSAVGEEDEDEDGENMFGPASGLSELYDDMSDDEESLASSSEPMSPSAESRRENDRLAKDEKRLRVDLEKHKELLVQSQAMNQSLKRCMYATEEMIREGKKALDYHVRVSDVKLGGRVLSSHEDDEHSSREIEVEDDFSPEDPAKGFLDVWTNVGRPSFEGSEGGDRDSGIEVDRPSIASLSLGYKSSSGLDSGRPPGDAFSGAGRDAGSLS